MIKKLFVLLVLSVLRASLAMGAVGLPSVFSDHMVLQRDRPVPVWGWASPEEQITVSFAEQTQTTTADDQGKWQVKLEPLVANAEPQSLTVSGENTVTVNDVLVGEVWICSGQSNMQFSVSQAWNSDLMVRSANHPQIRLLTNENAGVQKPMEDFVGSWQVCSPETVGSFSAVGFFFGLQLQDVLDVPIGLIDNSWGGSSCEAWVQRDRLAADDANYRPLLDRWAADEAKPELREPYEAYEAALLKWRDEWVAAKQSGTPLPKQPNRPNSKMVTQHRPGNLFNGRVHPLIPYAIRGVIWYQGESNAGRAYQYRDLFPLMIKNWREAWQQGDFPFYWVQLADFRREKSEPAESDWAELREAQTMALDVVSHTGQAVIIDIGEAADIHPKNKIEVAMRLARLALAQDYDVEIAHRSPRFDTMTVDGNKALLTFKHCGNGLRTVDANQVQGFVIAGNDKKWQPAQAKIMDGSKIEVWNEHVDQPAAVRYAWADNPICNVFSREGLPLTPFRTDDWPGITDGNR